MIALGASLPSLASADAPSLNYIEVGVGVQGRLNGADPIGPITSASYELNDNWYIRASYLNFDENERDKSVVIVDSMIVEETNINIDFAYREIYMGAGYKLEISERGILAFDLNYLDIDLSTSTIGETIRYLDNAEVVREEFSGVGSFGEAGIAARASVQFLFGNSWQTNFGIQQRYVDTEGETLDETSLLFEGFYYFTDSFGTKFTYQLTPSNDTSILALSVRYTF